MNNYTVEINLSSVNHYLRSIDSSLRQFVLDGKKRYVEVFFMKYWEENKRCDEENVSVSLVVDDGVSYRDTS